MFFEFEVLLIFIQHFGCSAASSANEGVIRIYKLGECPVAGILCTGFQDLILLMVFAVRFRVMILLLRFNKKNRSHSYATPVRV